MQLEELISIGTDRLTVYTNYPKKCHEGKVNNKSKINLNLKHTSTHLTKSAANKIKKILAHWILAINLTQSKQKNTGSRRRRYLVMLTLTLPSAQLESDKVFKRKYLNNFIIQLKSIYPEINYLWVAEKQKNGNIHFHVILDRWVNNSEVRNMWNKVLSNGEYIKVFRNKFHHSNPPSIHLSGQKEMGNPSNYLTKYVTKAELSLEIEGNKWGCSDNLRQIKTIKLLVKDWYKEYLYYYKNELKIKFYCNEHCEVYYFEGDFLNDFQFHDIFLDNEVYINNHLSSLYSELKQEKACFTAHKQKQITQPKQLSLIM